MKKKEKYIIALVLLACLCFQGSAYLNNMDSNMICDNNTDSSVTYRVSGKGPVIAEPTGTPEKYTNEPNVIYITSEGLMVEVNGELVSYESTLTEEELCLLESLKEK